eukprot:4094267-Pyramimonas_sp.AAC.1
MSISLAAFFGTSAASSAEAMGGKSSTKDTEQPRSSQSLSHEKWCSTGRGFHWSSHSSMRRSMSAMMGLKAMSKQPVARM